MCTLTIAWQTFPDVPVVVAANRDESFGRPSEPPGTYEPGITAPRDADAGGTWIGYTDEGLFVGITNRWIEGVTGDRSRGLLVRDALRAGDAETAARRVERAVERDTYAGFNLLVADAAAAILLEYDGQLAVRTLDPGVHVLGNVGIDGEFYEPTEQPAAGPRQADAARRLRAHLRPEPGEDAHDWLARAGDALGDHSFDVCVHGDGFGTVSSSLIALGADGSTQYRYADGPPCETEYVPIDRLTGDDDGSVTRGP